MRLRTELYFCRTQFDSYFSYSTYLLTLLYFTILHCTILYYIILYYTILYYIILYYTILYYTILFLGQKVVPCLLEVNVGKISRDDYFGKPSDDCFCNVKKIFLTTIMYMTTRDAFTAAKNLHRIGLKRYLMNRSSRVLLIFLFWFAKMPWSGRK